MHDSQFTIINCILCKLVDAGVYFAMIFICAKSNIVTLQNADEWMDGWIEHGNANKRAKEFFWLGYCAYLLTHLHLQQTLCLPYFTLIFQYILLTLAWSARPPFVSFSENSEIYAIYFTFYHCFLDAFQCTTHISIF